MFTLAVTPAYWWPVKVTFPADDGKLATSEFDARFKRLPQAEHDQLVASIVNPDTRQNDTSIAREVMIGWRKVNDPDGATIEFTDETFDKLLSIQGIPTAIVKAYLGSIKKAAEKNS